MERWKGEEVVPGEEVVVKCVVVERWRMGEVDGEDDGFVLESARKYFISRVDFVV